MLGKRELIIFFRNRLAVSLLAIFLLCVMILTIETLLNLHVSDVQVPARYSGYGFTNIYRDRWYSLLSFGLFGVIVFITNSILAVKLYGKRRGLALGILVASIFITILALVVASAIFRLATFSL